jgi:hypothetical protein
MWTHLHARYGILYELPNVQAVVLWKISNKIVQQSSDTVVAYKFVAYFEKNLADRRYTLSE